MLTEFSKSALKRLNRNSNALHYKARPDYKMRLLNKHMMKLQIPKFMESSRIFNLLC